MSARAAIRLLRVGIVPEDEIRHLSVGYDGILKIVSSRLSSLRTPTGSAPLFIQGEWGTGKSHCLSYIRTLALQGKISVANITLNARSTPLNYPQRLYAPLVESLSDREHGIGLQNVLLHALADQKNRTAINLFSHTVASGSLGWALRTLCDY